jgi:hypothetical protein
MTVLEFPRRNPEIFTLRMSVDAEGDTTFYLGTRLLPASDVAILGARLILEAKKMRARETEGVISVR